MLYLIHYICKEYVCSDKTNQILNLNLNPDSQVDFTTL